MFKYIKKCDPSSRSADFILPFIDMKLAWSHDDTLN